MLVCGAYITFLKQFKPWQVLTLHSCIVIVDTLTRFSLLRHICHLKAAQISVDCSLFRQLLLDEFKFGSDATEATKNILLCER